ncbi:MAG: acylneuraminate cytidylyltransferase family protein [Deltaproteobacteria bacterium]|nr:acylneuraminate cytidylyltransferase family protein [Deltaproteobacteria bacterium]
MPRKNIRPLCGIPLIGWTIKAARASSRLAKTVVSTDDPEIAEIARSLGGDVPFVRPAIYATDTAKSIEVVLHALKAVEELEGGGEYDATLLLQPTTPFRTASDIDGSIGLLERTGADSVISVVDVGGFHPARMKYLEGDRLVDPPFCEAEENMPRQRLRPMYLRAGCIYLTRRRVLMAGSFKGNDSRRWLVPENRAVNIDSERDFLFAEWLASRGADT